MDLLLTFFTGALVAVMVMVNGGLSGRVGIYLSAVVIHVVGTVFSFVLCKVRRETIFRRRGVPVWAYLGGAIGALSTLSNNFAYGKISMTSIVALSLLGQSFTSAFFDAFGLMGLQKRRIQRSALIGIGISCVGAGIMLDSSVASAFWAVLFSIATGVSLVVSRVVNARLAERAGAMVGAFYDHLIGLPFCALLWLLFQGRTGIAAAPAPWMLLGGVMGVAVVWLYNLVVPRVSSVRVSLLSFLGQLFTGFGIDLLTGQAISGPLFWGGVLCAAGFSVSMLLEFAEKRRAQKRTDYWKRLADAESAYRERLY